MEKISFKQENIRNVAIIAHVDHGKTTLVDAFMKQTHLFRENQEEMSQTRILDSGELEKEKGITIKAKNIAIKYGDFKINIIDTPGHADFGGEVERTLNMADSCLLLVDAQEGPMPQTKFVLKKALELGLKPILVINKIDKKLANCTKTIGKVQDLFLELATDPEQLDFPVYYAIAREGLIFKDLPEGDLTNTDNLNGDVTPILDEIVNNTPAPKGDINGTFQMQVTSLEYDNHLGRYLVGRINRGQVKVDSPIILLSKEEKIQGRVKELFTKEGLFWEPTESAIAGDIVALTGIESTAIGATICDISNQEVLPDINITPPSVKVKFESNSSPFAGKEGKFVTAKQLEQRLEQEKDTNISLNISKVGGSSYYVAGRGELQLSILVEQLRREGYEFQLSKPEVVLIEREGKKFEPIEELIIDCPSEYLSIITQEVSNRKGELIDIENSDNQTRFTYRILTRNLIGLHRILMNATKGTALINSFVYDYVPHSEGENLFRKGVIISAETGTSLGYALTTIQERGQLFTGPSEEVYEGMIIGINNHEQDLEVNPCKARHKTNVRMLRSEMTDICLKSTIQLTIEYALSFINDDELIEVTPKNIRLRKKLLTNTQRTWAKRGNLTAYAKQQMQSI
ncbi:translational GTPase TypA [Candidatus Dojkabacteria bacterium HGW-Dojkabacteria-1]|uniref:Translational GTPase TypA n=1 Tax=Candidatus Dojkabacteria bacterium HGW-Dojkabacteria-1 TaxID=2013761 RepID=A0A2N2F3Y1_9BACT|nr:MAG: translational GTPase TypA [Candidatus Dojkabacteria bacterium HGW-Dojkabacteria-1]